MTSTKEYIRTILKAKFPTLDTSEGSPLSELFLNPTAAILDPVFTQLKYLLDNLGLQDPESIHPDELDAIAANFLVYRNLGTPAAGYVEMFYDTPQSILIPANTIFSTDSGVEFVTSAATQVLASDMQANIWKYPLFSTGLIAVRSIQEAETVINPGEITQTDFEPAPVLVTNPTAITLGTVRETNTELAERLIQAVVNRSLASEKSINAFVQNLFPSIRTTIVVGADDDRMIRDLHYSGIEALQNYHLTDYYGKVSTSDFYTTSGVGLYVKTSGVFDSVPNFDQYPYPQSRAYWSLFYDDPTSSGLVDDLPTPDLFMMQFTTTQYSNLYYKSDAYKTTLRSTILLQDPFVGGELDTRWIKGDVHFGTSTLRSTQEIVPTSNGVRLGYSPQTAAELATQPLIISRAFIEEVKAVLLLASTLDPNRGATLDTTIVTVPPKNSTTIYYR